MAGETWLEQFEAAIEVTPGTAVASTRQMYLDPSSKFTRQRDPRPHKFTTGTRDNVRAFTLGPQKVAGQMVMPMSYDEIIELLLIGIQGAVTPTTPAGSTKLWTFKPSATIGSACFRWMDGARPWCAAGVRCGKIKIAGGVDKENTVTADVFGMSMVQQALTGSLTPRVPTFIEGWETKMYIDAFAGTPGTTLVAGTLLNWDVSIDNGMQYKYFADNTNAAGAVVVGELKVNAKLTFEAAPAIALTEFNNWDAATKRLVRLEFGNNTVIDTPRLGFVTVDLPGAWEAFELGGTDKGTSVYALGLQYVYDVTNTFGLQIRCQNLRTTAW